MPANSRRDLIRRLRVNNVTVVSSYYYERGNIADTCFLNLMKRSAYCFDRDIKGNLIKAMMNTEIIMLQYRSHFNSR